MHLYDYVSALNLRIELARLTDGRWSAVLRTECVDVTHIFAKDKRDSPMMSSFMGIGNTPDTAQASLARGPKGCIVLQSDGHRTMLDIPAITYEPRA